MGQRAYCDRDHPGGDAEADRWCETRHRPVLPRTIAELTGRPASVGFDGSDDSGARALDRVGEG
jgi:hypothetical protein